MNGLSSTLTDVLSALTVLSLAATAVVAYAAFSRAGAGARLRDLLVPKALPLAFLVSAAATLGSLAYSQLVGYPPCTLCWVQRIFLFPQAVLYGIALYRRDRGVAPYGIALSVLGGIVALYHSYTQLGGGSLLSCTSAGGECARVYFVKWGFVTLPFMSLAAFLLIGMLMVAHHRGLGQKKAILGPHS